MTSRILRHARKDHAGLDDNPRHNFAMNRALLVYPSGAVFTFIPKNGCTTLRVSLAMANGVLPDLEDWEWVHRNNRTFCASLREVVTAPFTFVVLRCPHARLASVFLDKMVEGGPLGRRFLAREGKERDLASVTFRDFVTMLDTPALLNFDPHWRPQVDFLVYEDYDLWVPLERFAQHIPQIEAGAGMKIQDARQLSGHGTDRLEAVGKGRPACMPTRQGPSWRRCANRARRPIMRHCTTMTWLPGLPGFIRRTAPCTQNASIPTPCFFPRHSARQDNRHDTTQGHHSGRRIGNPALSADHGPVEAASADL